MSDITHAQEHSQGSYASYIIGFVSSLSITIGAYIVVTHHKYDGRKLVFTLMGLAIVQLYAQLVFFLHLGRGSKTKWNTMLFMFMLLVVFIIVGGTLWIMYHLNYNMMSPRGITHYVNSQDDL